jgi:hypothetical protein
MVWQDLKRYAAAKLLVPSEAFSPSSADWTGSVIDLIYSARAVTVVDEATAPLKLAPEVVVPERPTVSPWSMRPRLR